MRDIKPGERISEYVLDREIGRGGFGTVFRATHHALKDRVVAIKVALDEERAALLRHEGVLQDVVRHPHAVEVLGLDAEHEPPYLVMEYVDGESLRERLAREERLPVAEALRIGEEVLEALACAHARGILHLDLKPANVLLDRLGTAKLSDFGLGRARESERAELLVSGHLQSRTDDDLVGTLPYMAPEQKVPGRTIDARTDVYAFGILLFEMLTGARPEGGEVPSDRVPGLDSRIDAVFRQCYCPMERRFPDGSAVLASMRPLRRAPVAPRGGSPAGQIARLERVHPDGREPEVVPLGVRPISVGNHAAAGLRVRAPWVSWWHAEISHKDGAWWVRDLGSKSGTFLLPAAAPGGSSRLDHLERVGREPQRLGEGVELCLGDPRGDGGTVRFRVRDGQPAGERVVIGPNASDAERWSAMGQGATWFGVLMLAAGSFCVLRLGRIFISILLLSLGVVSLLVASFLEPRAEGGVEIDARGDAGAPGGPLIARGAGGIGPPAAPAVRAVALVFDLGVVALFVRLLAGEALAAIPVVWLVYEGLTTGLFGATPGKWLCGLKVTDRRGQPIGAVRSIVRAFAKILSAAVMGLGFLPAFLTRDARAAHDMAAETRVVQVVPPTRR